MLHAIRFAVLLLLVHDAVAGDTPEQVAARVLAAESPAALLALANRNVPDPWLVADVLCAQKRHDVALAFARAAPRRDVAGLPAYIEAQRAESHARGARAARTAAEKALEAGDAKAAFAALAPFKTATHDVTSVRILFARGAALRALARFRESARSYRAASDLAARIGWGVHRNLGLSESAQSSYAGSDWRTARATWEQLLPLEERAGRRIPLARILGNLGHVHVKLDEYDKALAYHERALVLAKELGNRAELARALSNLGSTQRFRGAVAEARDYSERALRFERERGHRAGVARNLTTLGQISYGAGDIEEALAYQQEALALHKALGKRSGIALNLTNIGLCCVALGDYERALASLEESRAIHESLADRAGIGDALVASSHAYLRLGMHAKALAQLEGALEISRSIRSRARVAGALSGIGLVHEGLGDYKSAISFQRQALRAFEEVSNVTAKGATLGNLGNNYLRLGAIRQALECHKQALAIAEKSGHPGREAAALGNMAAVFHAVGALDKSLACLERALPLAETANDRRAVVDCLNNIGEIHLARKEFAAALKIRSRALELSTQLASAETGAYLHWGLADIHMGMENHVEAARSARRGVDLLPRLVGRLADEQGSRARGRWNGLLEVGIRAAAAMRDPVQLSFFLETGRAGALLESLDNRTAIKNAAIPAGLRKQELAAMAGLRDAQASHERALRSGKRKAIRTARAALDAARSALTEAQARILRAAKGAAEVLYPEAAPLAAIQSSLVADEALVLYGLLTQNAVALVVTRQDARVVTLGAAAPIEAARRTFGVAAPDRVVSATTLRRLVVTPLALPPTIKRVLISPHKSLAYLPFAVLLEDRDIAYIPSGTTHRLLRAEHTKRGDGVLAFGDPDYRGRKALAPLPGSRAEARAIGDVVFLGEKASERALHQALRSRERWRAVHLACHGSVDIERPMRSSLALAQADDDDGLLTTLEVFRMKCHADLVVLSACVTGKGKVYEAEGVVGFTRAFMLAGAPRVMVSLWKVDDSATRALMTKFYALWKPGGVSTASALRQAQEHVRAHEKWKNPYYWAAWQLWGLAD